MNTPTPNGLTAGYLQLCQQHRQEIRELFPPVAWNWLLGPDGISRVAAPARPLDEDEMVVPRLDSLIRRLREHAEVVVIDCLPEDYACLAFDEDGNTLVNVVADGAEEAALRALLLLTRKRAEGDTS